MAEPTKVTSVTVRAELDDGSVITVTGGSAEVLIDRERSIGGIAFDELGVPELRMEAEVYRLTITEQGGLLQVRRQPLADD